MTVLVVVANQAVCADVVAQLQQRDATVHKVSTVNEAMFALRKETALVIVEDTHAIEIAAYLADLPLDDVVHPALLVLGPNTVQSVRTALHANADEFVSLPLDTATFATALQTIFQRARFRAEQLRRAYRNGRTDEYATLVGQVQAESLGLMSRLAANIAHEINNPLTPILGLAAMVSDEAPPQSTALFASQTITTSARRIANIVHSLMSFTRPLALLEEVDMHELIEDALLEVRHTLEEQRIRVQTNVFNQPITLVVSIAEMRQALFLMIEHARLLMPNGGTLELMLKCDQDTVMIEVCDTGSPVAAYHLPHIFEPFYSATGPGIGLGTGLAIVQRIVEQHGGTVALEPGIEQGNTLRATLPAR